MLCLTRKIGERVRIGDGITVPFIWVVVIDHDRGKFKLGIDCDRSIPIQREEVISREDRANG